ncbi:MAG: hypothetical protein QGH40_01970 [bacterium]|jgi:hypothetical protein|nr:hypothetical protein [bacterium]
MTFRIIGILTLSFLFVLMFCASIPASDDVKIMNSMLRSLGPLAPGSPLFQARLRQLEQEYERYLEKKRLSPYGNHNYSVILAFLGKHGLALKYEEMAAFWRPGELIFQLGLFMRYMDLGSYEKALAVFIKIRKGIHSGNLATSCRKPPGLFLKRIQKILKESQTSD